MAVKTTEREVADWISKQIDKIIEKGGYPFTSSSTDPSLPGNTSLFPDIVIWFDRQAGDAFAFIELKPPGKYEDNERLPEVAERLRVNYAITWNFSQAILFHCDNKLTEKKRFPTHVISELREWLQADKQIEIIKHLKCFLDDLKELNQKGHLHQFEPDKYFFINLLHDTTNSLKEYFVKHLQKANQKKEFKKEIEAFITEQGFPDLDIKEINELVAGQWVYGLITKLLFYLTIRRNFQDLPDIVADAQKSRSFSDVIKRAFNEARKLDWQAVFEAESRYEKIGIPQSCNTILKDLLKRLDEYNFGKLKEDVIGEIFENLIPENEKQKYGQYFTGEDLVDFILGFVVQDTDGYYCDPTCGSGTFLNRMYSRLKFMSAHSKKHQDILPQIWGFDIAKFPAELATINLFKQEISDYRNFPQIQVSDFFDIKPGQIFKFPPPKADPERFIKIERAIPQFDGLAGNFPFIRQEQIEKKVPGNKAKITRVLLDDWKQDYPELFNINKKKGKEIKLSGQADIYAYLFFHVAKFMKPNGRLGFITSNSYLDVGYGYELKKFFLKKFKIVAIVASWAEPWFDFASVNTIFTIIEQCNDESERTEHVVKFVKVKKKLKDLIPYPDLEFDEINRWNHIDKLVRKIEYAYSKDKVHSSYEDDNFRIRFEKQEDLLEELEDSYKYTKWGKYLRAPDVYFDILDKAKDKLILLKDHKDIKDIRRGYTTGINDFFYLEPTGLKTKSKKYINVKNKKGWIGDIEKIFLKPVIKSPKESDKIEIDNSKLKYLLFMCDYKETDLKASGYKGAFDYIQWGKQQKTKKDGMAWPIVPSVKSRKYWWNLGCREPYLLLMQMVNNDRFLIFTNCEKAHVDHNLFEIDISSKFFDITAALLNSSFLALNREIISRINLGDGATKTEGIDWENNIFIFDYHKFTKRQISKIVTCFNKIKIRPILSFKDEIKQKDRQDFDKAILEAANIDPVEYLPRIYKGLGQIVEERLNLPKMRKKTKKLKYEVSTEEVKKKVEEEILPDGLNIFPDFYISNRVKFLEINTSGKNLKIGNHFFGKYEIIDTDNQKIYEAKGIDEANYIVCAYKPNEYIIKIPENEKIIIKAVTEYNKYIVSLFRKLTKRAYSGTQNHNAADQIALDILRENGYSGSFELS